MKPQNSVIMEEVSQEDRDIDQDSQLRESLMEME
jgi:hypothetical protein